MTRPRRNKQTNKNSHNEVATRLGYDRRPWHQINKTWSI